MSPNERNQADPERIRKHYNQALDLTRGLLTELRQHGPQIDLEALSLRLAKREKLLHKAAQATRSLVAAKEHDKRAKLECRSVQQVVQEIHDRGEELVCLLSSIKDETGRELKGYETGGKLMKAYKGFKASQPLRLNRQA